MPTIRRGLIWLKDLFFPKFCLGCEQEGDWLCRNCLPRHVIANDFTFEADADKSGLDGLTALFSYGDNLGSELVRTLKYKYITEVLSDFHRIILAANFSFAWQDFVIVPVPLHPRRERERGFNQAERIAELFAERLNLEINKNLRRSVYTAQQARLSGVERRKNLNNAFVFTGDGQNSVKKVLLVDDVFTTGSTMNECAKALKAAGVGSVWGLVLAKG